MTPPEAVLWQHPRARPSRFKFRRQHPFGPYVLDFFCRAAGIAIEVDGAGHQLPSRRRRDAQRDAWLAEQGIHILRFRASEVRNNLTGVLALIQQECASRSPSTG
jgi:very-short-patch-repair endonuclease